MSDLATRTRREREIAEALVLIFGQYESQALSSAATIRWGQFHQEVREAIRKPLEDAYVAANLALLLSKGQESAEPGDRATEWAFAQATEVAALLTETTRQHIADAIKQAGLTGEGLADLLGTTFSEARASVIAATEITRAISMGESAAVLFIGAQVGAKPDAVWITERDERVCPVCAPLHESPEEDWRGRFPMGPPAHPNCRCWLEYT